MSTAIVEEGRALIERIAASRRFARAMNMRRLLHYLAEETLSGRGEQLKPLAIGQNALGRGPRFDPQTDPIVRVEAARLRKLLAEYALDEGAGDALRVSLPLGAYVLHFERVEGTAPGNKPAAHPATSTAPVVSGHWAPAASASAQRRRRMGWAAAAALAVGVAAAAAFMLGSALLTPRPVVELGSVEPAARLRSGSAPAAAGRPAEGGRDNRIMAADLVVKVRAFEAPANDVLSAALAKEAETRLRDALARFDGLTVVASGRPRPVPDALLPQLVASTQVQPAEPAIDYAVEGAIARDGFGRHRFEGRLVDARHGTIVSSRLIEEPFHTAPEVSPNWLTDVVREVSSRLASPYGVLQAHERRINPVGDPLADRRACHRLTFELWRSFQADVEMLAIACLDAALRRDPTDSLSLSLLAYNEAVALRERRLFGGARPDSVRMLERAQAALALSPVSATAMQALFGVHKVRGESALAMAAGRRALRANPYDLDLMADVGAYLVMQGQVDEGRSLLDAAVLTNPNPPQWVWGVNALAALIDNDEPRMLAAIARSHGMGYALNGLMHLVVMSRQGRAIEAQRFQEELMRRYPEFESNVRDALRHLTLADPVIARLLPEVGWLRNQ